MRKHIGNYVQISAQLLDVVAVTGGAAADPAFAAVVAPDPRATLNSNRFLDRRRRCTNRCIVTMDADEVATQVMLATERPATSAVGADMRFQTVGVMSCLVGLEIVGSSKGSGAVRAPVFLSRVNPLTVNHRA